MRAAINRSTLRSISKKAWLSGAGLLVLATVSGCSMLHSNIRGGFLCSAPDGSCAPTTVIDDGALKTIRQNPSSGDLTLPAVAPKDLEPAQATAIYTAEKVGSDPALRASLSGRALKLVYFPRVEANGRQVPRLIAYAAVDLPEWSGMRNEPVLTVDGKVSTGRISRGLLGAAENAPELLAASSAGTPVELAKVGQEGPINQPVAKAQAASGTAMTSIDQIKADAEKIISEAKKSAPAATKSAGTFSVSGN